MYGVKKGAQWFINSVKARLTNDTGDYRDAVFLAGVGRSGTTWVEEVINYGNDFRILFEPFHSKRIALLEQWNYRQYLRPDNQDPKFLQPAAAILSGNIRHPWVDRFNRNFRPKRRLIKDIRANLFLAWTKRQFPEIPIILLLRHPCAVALSKVKLGWDSSLDHFFAQQDLMDDHLHPFLDRISKTESDFERFIVAWCIENYVPLRQLEKSETLVVLYEELCEQPATQAERILSYIGLEYSDEVVRRMGIPSALSRKDSPVVSGTDLITSWKKKVELVEVDRAMDIIRMFGLDAVYDADARPRVSSSEVLEILA